MNYGVIRLSTNPVGSTVFVNSQNKGTTPIDIVNVNPGIYNITLAHPGLESYNFDTAVIDGKIIVIYFNFLLQEVTEEHITLTGADLVKIQPPPGLPEEEPPGLPPEKNEKEILIEINKTLEKNNELLDKVYSTIDLLRQYIAKSSGFDVTERYFTQGSTAITTVTSSQPESPDSVVTDCQSNPVPGVTSGYDRICVNQVLNRNARTITVTNDGTVTLFIITSSDGIKWSRDEIPIFRGEYKRFFNIYELRIRANKIGVLEHNITVGGVVRTVVSYGGIYRVTEFETENALFNVNRTAIYITTYPNLLVIGIGIVIFTITGNMINTPVAFRASVTNTDVVYATYAGGNILNAAQRITLNPGDTFRVNITNGAQIGFAGASVGQTMELLQESDLT